MTEEALNRRLSIWGIALKNASDQMEYKLNNSQLIGGKRIPYNHRPKLNVRVILTLCLLANFGAAVKLAAVCAYLGT